MQRYLIAIGLLALLSLNGCRGSAHFSQGSDHYNAGRYEEAIAESDEAIRERSDFAEAYAHRGLVYHELDRYEEAAAGFDKAIRERSDDAHGYILRGIAHFDLDRQEKAIADYLTALTLAQAAGDYYLAGEIEETLEGAVGNPRLHRGGPTATCGKGDSLQIIHGLRSEPAIRVQRGFSLKTRLSGVASC